MKILAVDFNGVINDSDLKSLFVSPNAYCKQRDIDPNFLYHSGNVRYEIFI